VIEEGLSARTTMLSDPTDPRLDGSAYLPSALASHLPLDLVILMLGTNDTKAYFHRTPFEIAAGMSKLVGQVLSSAGGVGTTYPAPEVLIIAPPPLTPMPHAYFQSLFGGAHEKSAEFGKLYGDLADFMKVHFLNAGDHISTDGIDGIHFTPENNNVLGHAVARKVEQIFG
jgi:lysophospholipase L1-like esterase